MALTAVVLTTSGKAIADQTSDGISTAQSIIQSAFPELRSEKYVALVSIDPPQTTLPWRDSRHLLVRISRQGASTNDPPEVSAEFWFNAAGPDQVSIQGAFVSTDAYRALVRRIDDHPGWSEEEMAVEAFSAGAEFLPSRVTVSALNDRVQRLAHALGNVKRSSPRFDWRTFGKAGIVWVIDIETVSGRCYVLELEPFKGNLVHLSSTECHP